VLGYSALAGAAATDASRAGADAAAVSGYRAGFLAVAGLLALAALVSAFAPGAPAPQAERRSESSPDR
jgi:hypothetical protein